MPRPIKELFMPVSVQVTINHKRSYKVRLQVISMKNKGLLFFSCMLILSNCASASAGGLSDSISLKANWKNIKKKGYSLSYPSNWVMSEGSADGIAFTLQAPGPKSFGGYEENINLMIHDVSGKNMDLDSYSRLCERQIHTMVNNSKMILSERSKDEGAPYHLIMYTGEYDEQLLKWKMRFWIAKGKVYTLTYTSTKETFGMHLKVADEIMDTFNLR